MGAVAVSWLLFQPWVQKEALLTATLPCLPQLWALRDPLRCHPGLPSAGCCLALGLAQDRPGRVSGGPCPPPPAPSHPVPAPAGLAGWLVGWVLLLHLLLAAATRGKSPSTRGSGGEPPVAVATAGQPWLPAAPPPPRWLHPLRGKRTV